MFQLRQASSRLARVLRVGLACALLGTVWAPAAGAPLQAVDEYTNKAGALIELATYFKWPVQKEALKPFLVLVVGDSKVKENKLIREKLADYARGRTISQRRIEVLYAAAGGDLPACDMVFICSSEWRSAREIIDWAHARGILTVADRDDFGRKGVMVNLLIESGFLKIYLNHDLAKERGFTVSSQLLKLTKQMRTN